MNESNIKDYKGILLDILDKSKESLNEYDNKEKFFKNEKEIREKIYEYKPSLMFYGVYNAGKSTLLNSIFGEEKAAVADIPETNKISNYLWNGYDLIDTPGINGPEEDYRLSKSEIIKHDIIMFVIDDSDTFDNRLVSEEIVNIIKLKKPLIIVLNSKQSANESSIAIKKDKLYFNINIAAKENEIGNLEGKFDFIGINAKSALKAKKDGKNLLLEKSNLPGLEKLILTRLKEMDGPKVLNVPMQNIENELNNILRFISMETTDELEKKYLNFINDANESKNNSIRYINSKIKSILVENKNIFYNKLIEGKSIDCDVETLSNLIEDTINKEMKKILSILGKDLKCFMDDISINLNITLKNFELKNQNIKINDDLDSYRNYSKEELCNNLSKQLKKDSNLIKLEELPIILTPFMPEIILLPILIKTFKRLFGNSNKEIANREEILNRIEEANQRQSEAFQKRILAMQEVRTNLDIQFKTIEDDVNKEMQKYIDKVFDAIINETKVELETYMSKKSKYQEITINLKELIDKLNYLKSNINN